MITCHAASEPAPVPERSPSEQPNLPVCICDRRVAEPDLVGRERLQIAFGHFSSFVPGLGPYRGDVSRVR